MDIRRERSPARPRRAVLALAVTAAAVFGTAMMLAACSTVLPASQAAQVPSNGGLSGNGDASTPPPDGSEVPAWLLTRSALAQLLANPSVQAELAAAQVYEILQPGQQPLPGFAARSVFTFTSAAALQDAVSGGQLPAGAWGVLYDPEAWSFTPLAEQQDPVQAATQAAAVAHAHGLKLIVTPALDLTTVLAPGGSGPRWQQFLSLNLIASLAQVADVVELQAQSLERSTTAYTSFVRSATAQARAANPDVGVLAGLSTNPPGAAVDSQQLTAAIQATRSIVDGFWLNIPGQGPRCPACNPPAPQIAIATLLALG